MLKISIYAKLHKLKTVQSLKSKDFKIIKFTWYFLMIAVIYSIKPISTQVFDTLKNNPSYNGL